MLRKLQGKELLATAQLVQKMIDLLMSQTTYAVASATVKTLSYMWDEADGMDVTKNKESDILEHSTSVIEFMSDIIVDDEPPASKRRRT